MAILKNDGCNPKDRMRKATEEWKRQKKTDVVSEPSDVVSVVSEVSEGSEDK